MTKFGPGTGNHRKIQNDRCQAVMVDTVHHTRDYSIVPNTSDGARSTRARRSRSIPGTTYEVNYRWFGNLRLDSS